MPRLEKTFAEILKHKRPIVNTKKDSSEMEKKDLQVYFLISLTLAIFIVVALMFLPFLNALVLATTFAVIFEPLHRRMTKISRGQKNIAALSAILIILVIVFVPLTLIGLKVFDQAQNLYVRVIESKNELNPIVRIENSIEEKIQDLFPQLSISLNIQETIALFFKWLTQNIGPIFQGLANILTSFLLGILAIYYLFKDGEKLKHLAFKISPLPDSINEEIFKKLKVAIGTVIQGSLIVAITQGVLAGIGFTIFGVPNAAFWGFITVIAALVPIVGTSLVLTPIIIYLFAFDTLFSAIGLLAWGLFAVGLVDNFIGPKLIQRRVQIHNFFILLSVLGGISFFGPMGFLIGPLFLALFVALLNVYPTLVLNKSEGSGIKGKS